MQQVAYPPAVRGLVKGAIAALILGGLALTAAGTYTVTTAADCHGLTPEECLLKQDVNGAFARRQLLFGAALSAFGVAIWMLTRERLKSKPVETMT